MRIRKAGTWGIASFHLKITKNGKREYQQLATPNEDYKLSVLQPTYFIWTEEAEERECDTLVNYLYRYKYCL